MKNKSWKTTAAGISAIVVAVAGAAGLMLDGKPDTNPDWTALIAARDNDKSSEDVGSL